MAMSIFFSLEIVIMFYELRFHYDNLAKHNVLPAEVEECFSDPRKSVKARAGIYWLIGKTESGRLLQIGYRKQLDRIFFVFHAMNASDSERRRYKTRGK
jgi:hypothetical protein